LRAGYNPSRMKTADFDYDLPPELIAQHPTPNRVGSRLLYLDGSTGGLRDDRFSGLPDYFRDGDLLVINDTRVLKARLSGRKASGGKVEIMVERVVGEHEALAFVRAANAPKAGTALILDSEIRVEVLGREGELFHLGFSGEASVHALLEAQGRLPLPPYIRHLPDADDETRYQTVYGRVPGAVAAPTAGLHFDEGMLEQLSEQGVSIAGVTLHVGSGTFAPVRVEDIEAHSMHAERYFIPEATAAAVAAARAEGRRVTAVGTTALRALEAAAQEDGIRMGEGETDLFITPGYDFRVVDRLITNFHLPRSTLLMLVSAFAGVESTRRAYAHAIAQRYRFFSYGDVMLIDKKQ
jgi:S-adenosylmethionine:tRNA ribosyltransferase-isomerase